MILEGGIEINHEGMADMSEEEALGVDMFQLSQSDYIRLTKDLHGKMCLPFELSQTDEQNRPCLYRVSFGGMVRRVMMTYRG